MMSDFAVEKRRKECLHIGVIDATFFYFCIFAHRILDLLDDLPKRVISMHLPEKFTTADSGDLRYLFRQIDELGELWDVQIELVMW